MRCDAVAVAVGLIDRKHVGVVGANRDAAAAKGDREYLHPVHISAPLKSAPGRWLCWRCAKKKGKEGEEEEIEEEEKERRKKNKTRERSI